ncbi:CoA transferase [Arthrobacter bambusae]|uniref:CaiB/BaiF CoA transferase family protein n=1 Tax=Arthrobacter bambusae TaxID=1338426 RepID=UPI001F51490C|nr:CaiB/BaiF CoA-transferase family protein [Arthrobacter bambusae]MCI0142618.1 CoA transferase [Arthrobacter bambusae]
MTGGTTMEGDSQASTGPLSGVTVVSIEQAISGPLATRHLAELGARVIKVEFAGGDSTRSYDQCVNGMSAHFVWLNRGKESARLNLKEDADRGVFETLLAGADVFVTNMAPGALARLGFDPQELHQRLPQLIIVDISGFGAGGPLSHRRAYDLLVQAESGVCSLTGAPGFPVKPGVPTVDIGTALYAFSAIATALFSRTRTGKGAYIPLAMFDVASEMSGFALNQVIHTGVQPDPVPMGTPMLAPYGAYPTGDGQTIVLGATSNREWLKLTGDNMMADPEFATDTRFATNEVRIQHREALDAHIAAWTSRHTLAELQAKADAAQLGNARLNNTIELSKHPQLRDRGRWHQASVQGGSVPALKAPFVGGSWDSFSDERVPELGEDTERIRNEFPVGRNA